MRRNRIRHLIAPTMGLRRAALLFFVGGIGVIVGIVASFGPTVQQFITAVNRSSVIFVEPYVGRPQAELYVHWLGALLMFLGAALQFLALRGALRQVIETLNPSLRGGKVDTYVRRQQLAQGPRIVAIGGGTGLSTLLRGLKQHSSNITAIVTVTDDGGSSGRLAQEKGMIPPGDIRNCLVALADAEKSMTDLFQYRFRSESGSLSGHAIGNLLIAALTDQARGDFERAIATASEVLAIRGQVMPATLDHVGLRALMEDGEEVFGETAIVERHRKIKEIRLAPAEVEAYPPAIEEILNADLICIGPGSVYTSIIPPLLVPGIAKAIRQSNAIKVYICNVMTQPGESDSFSASQHASAILTQVKERVFDFVLVNTGSPTPESLERYAEYGQHLVESDLDRVAAMGLKALQGNYMSETDVVRHDPMKVVARLMALIGL